MTINKTFLFTGGIIAAIYLIQKMFGVQKTWSKINDQRIANLHPKLRTIATKFINDVQKKLNTNLLITSGLRTFEEQKKIYAQGRTTPGSIVTYAPPGSSYHNYGLAFDVAYIDKNGKPDWTKQISREIANIGKKNGLDWGGNWTKPFDPPHFQLTLAPTSKLLKLYNTKAVDSNGYVII